MTTHQAVRRVVDRLNNDGAILILLLAQRLAEDEWNCRPLSAKHRHAALARSTASRQKFALRRDKK